MINSKYFGILLKKAFIIVIFLCLIAGPAFTLDYPHTGVNNIGCDSCHYIYGGEPSLLPEWTNHVQQDIDDTQYNVLCWSCHNDIEAPYVRTHSSLQIDNDYGDWTNECRTCHNPHSQDQLKIYTSASFLYSGTSTDITSTTLTKTGAGWTDDEYAGRVLIPNVDRPTRYKYGYKITDNSSDTITVEGPIDTSRVSIGDTFAIIYGKIIKNTIALGDIIDPMVPKTGDKTVRFFTDSGTNSYADGNSTYDGVCEVCHTETKYHQNDGGGFSHNAGLDCMQCHFHTRGFAHGSGGGSSSDCEECHGHDPGYGGFTGGKGSYVSHSTHTEDDSDDLRGPHIGCDTCHNTSLMPYFKSGTDADEDGRIVLSETDVCDTCHSPGGTYDGVNDATVGAKNNWSEAGSSTSPIYAADGSLQTGKGKWCAGCHDEEPSEIDSVSAPNVIGDEDGSYTYGTGWGFYKTGHGVPASTAYPYKGGFIEPSLVGGASRPVECDSCHDFTTAHIDGDPRTFDDGESSSTDPSVYRQAYRLDLVPLGQGSGDNTREPLLVPRPANSGNTVNQYRLCTTCHDSGPFLSSSDTNTNLETAGVNRHEYHLAMNSYQYPADWNGGNTSMITCVVCHNVHGSTRLAMIRDGKLTGREPGLRIWYKNDSITENIGASNPPSPENLPLAASDGTAWISNTVHNLCVGCHNSGLLEGKDRTPFQDTAQSPSLDWTGEAGYVSDGASPDIGASGSAFTFRVKYADTNNDAPGVIAVWVDVDDSGSYEADEKYSMSGVDTGDVNYADGKLYTKSLTINSAGDNIIKYRFYATDGTLTASGDPTGDGSVTLTASTANNVPLLEWVTGSCRDLGVSPAAEVSGTVFEFYVKYTDADDEFSSLQVWVDLNDDGDYDDASEKQDMTVDGGDGDYSNGENFTKTITLSYAGDGVLNYLFIASDGTDNATGEPTDKHTVTVIDTGLTPVTVCASGCDDTTVQSAIDTAKSGDKLTLVYSGTYNERLSLWESSYSNSTVRSVCGPDDTTLTYSGDEVIFLQNVTGITIDGFEITGGTSGIDSNAGQASVNNCKIHGNNSAGGGGGLHAGNSASRFTVTNSEIYSNTATTNGGAAAFDAGTGYSFTNTTIHDNTAGGGGGAVFSQNGDIDFIDSTIKDNTASGSGGAVYSNASDITFTRATITGNTATTGSSGVIVLPGSSSSVVFESCIVADNQGVNGGVTFANTGSNLTAVNTTFANNQATGDGGAFSVQNSTVVIRNSILWNNSAGSSGHIAWFNGGSMTVTDTVISSGNDGIPTNAPYFSGGVTPTVSGYVSENDPYFVDEAGGDYHILSTSDAVDNANATYAPADDIDGDTRPQGSADDIGADEYVFSVNAPSLAWTGETNYPSDGVDPDSAVGGTSFEFRIDYTDSDDDAPAFIQVWIDEDDNGAYSSDEKYDMTETDGGDTDYTDGKRYSKSLNLAMAGDGDLSYRFYASDGTFEATGDPTSNSTVTVTNNTPVLSWTGETNYSSDGVDPDSAVGGTSFEFRIDYTDADNTAPSSIQVWVDEDDSGSYESGEKYDMTGTDGGDTTYADGKRYTKSLNILYAGNGSLNYRFYASDGSDDATGTPASDQTVTVTNNAPTLAWTGETNYTSDGVDPDSGPDSSSFTFRIDYTDTDNTAPSSIQVWIDEDDSTTYDEDEKFDMTETDGGDTDYTDGKRYSVSRTLSYTGDGVYSYRFYASDGTDVATGDPVSDGTVTVTFTPNNAPVLAWTGETNYTTDGVDPDSSHDGDTFTFRVKYTDDDDEAPTSIQVWIDEDDSTTYEAGEKYDMSAVDAGDTTYTDGKLYTVDRVLSFAGDGVLNYRFFANDGTDDATGAPATTGGTVTVVDPITVCSTGADFTTIQGAISDAGTTDGDYVQVCDGTYSENINFNGKNITVYSENGSASTTIQGSGADSPVVTFSNGETTSAVLKGFTIDNQTSGGNSRRGMVITNSSSPTIRNSIIKGNVPASYVNGPAIYIDGGGASIENSTIGDQTSYNSGPYGGGIYARNAGPALTITDSSVIYNQVSAQGGGVYLLDRTTTTTLTNSTVTNNTASQNGGGIYTSNAPLVIANSTIDDNSSTQPLEGGGLYLTGSSTTLTITGTTSISNNSGRNGGAINANSIGAISISDTTIDNNSASSEGAGMLLSGMTGDVSLTNTNITNNTGTTAGAGMKFTTSTARSLTITNSTISNNEVTASNYDCSGVCIFPSDVTGADVTVTITGSTISGNSARNAGGLSASSGTYSTVDLTITGSTFSSNEAKGGAGGGLSLNGSRTTVNISKSWIKGNRADTHGGGIYNTADTTITNSFITGNLANGVSYSAGAGINSGGNVQAYNCTIAGNRVGRDGGGWSGGGTITNSIFWGNYAEGSTSHQINGTPTVSYSDVAGGFTGTGNIDSDPYLIDLQVATTDAPTTEGNFHICNAADDPVTGCGGESAAKDTASSTDAPSDDYDGDTRPAGGGFDMGADEIAGSGSNSIPALAWTGETNYTADGVDPDSGAGGGSFIFRVKYTDADDEAPASIRVWIDEDDSETYEAGEKYDMTIDGGNGDYTDGEIFTKTVALSYTGDGSLHYRFYANDGTDDAVGTPTLDSTVTVTNTAPVLDWTGETNYTADGVDPDSGNSGSDFTFRVKYTDDNDDAPSSIQVWIDENDNSTYEGFEYYDMTETDGGDTDYTDGKLYSVTRAISFDGDGTLNYRFYASDGTDTATGTPTSDSTFDVVQTISGTVYTDEGVTTIADGATVRLIVNGSDAGTDTTSSGAYSIGASVSAGDAIIVYIDGHASDGTTVTVSDGGDLSGLDIYADRLITRHDNSSSLTNTLMNAALGAYSDAEILYTVAGSDLTVSGSSIELFIPVSHTFVPGGVITTAGMDINGTLDAEANAINVSGGWDATGGVFTSNGTVTFNAGSGTVTIKPGGTDTNHDFQNIVFNDSAGSATFQLGGSIDVDGDFTVTDGIIDTTGSSYAITVGGNFSQAAAGQVEANSSTITVAGDFTADGTTDSTDYNNASLIMTGGASNIYYTNLTDNYTNGINNLSVGASGTDVLQNALAIRDSLTIGAGGLSGATIFMGGSGDVFSFNAAANLGVSWVNFMGNSYNLPTLTNGYDANIRLLSSNASVTQAGDVTINSGSSLYVDGGGVADRPVTYSTGTYALTVVDDIILGAGSDTATKTLNATDSTVTVGGDFTINDSSNVFTSAGSTIVLNGTGQAINGSVTFNNLTKSVASADTLTFEAGETITINGTVTLNGADSHLLTLASSTGSSAWNIVVNAGATKAIDYVSVSWSDASGSDESQKPIDPTNSTDGGDNTDWFVPDIEISGTVYTDEGTTTIADGATVRLIVNGSSAGTDTASSGAYLIDAPVRAGDAMIVYIDEHASDGTTVTVSDGNALAGLDIYTDRLITRHDNSSSLTNADMDTAKGAYSDTEILYSVSGGDLNVSGTVTELYIWSGDIFAPGGAVDTVHMDINGTLNAAANAINVSGNWDADAAGVFTSTGTVTFDAANGTNTITPGGTDANHDFQNIVFNDAGGTATWELQGDVDADGDITVTDGILDTKNGSNYNVTAGGNFTDTAAGRVIGNWQSLFTVGGDFTLDFNSSDTEKTDMGYANITITGAGTLTINNLNDPWTYGIHKLTAGQSGNTTNIVSNTNFAIRNLLTVGSGTVTGSVSLYFLYDATFSFDAASTLSVDNIYIHGNDASTQNLPSLANGYDTNIRLTGPNTTLNQTGNVVINVPYDLTIDGGGNTGRAVSYSTAGYSLTVGGDLTVGFSGDDTAKTLDATNSTVTVGGDLSLFESDNGVFTTTGSTVVLNGTGQDINGSITFNNLTKTVTSADALTFEAGKTTTINGAATLNGASGQLLTLASSTGSSAWNFVVNSGATKDIDYVSVSWSDASGSDASHTPIDPTNSVDGGNNIDWFSITGDLNVTKTDDTNDGTCDADCSLREAIEAANASSDANTINVPAGTYEITISGTDDTNAAGDFDITNPVTISGAGSGLTIIQEAVDLASAVDRIFHDTTSAAVTIEGVKVQYGNITAAGGCIYTAGNLTVKDSIIDSCTATSNDGGAVYSSASVTIDNSTISNGTAGDEGGAIYTSGLTITNGATFEDNYAADLGGGIYNATNDITMSGDVTFTNNDTQKNQTTDYGGAIWSSGSISHSGGLINFTNNDSYQGGAIYIADSSKNVSLNSATFDTNTSLTNGGAIISYGLTVTGGGTFTDNFANDRGGAIRNFTNDITLTGNFTFTNNDTLKNHTTDYGGAIWSSGNVTHSGGTINFTNNDSYQGGAIYIDDSTKSVSLNAVTLNSNTSSTNGGAIVTYGLTITGGITATDNFASDRGGAIRNITGDISIDGEINFTNNDSNRNHTTDHGGAIWSSGDLTLNPTTGTATFTNNDAYNGGAIYLDSGKTLTAGEVTFTGNTATNVGGAIQAYGITITGPATFQNNSVNNDGGAIYNATNPLSINGTIFFDNNDAGTGSGDYGGAIYSNADVTLNDVSGTATFQNSQAYQGGAIFVDSAATLTLGAATTFDANYAGNIGGAIQMYGGTMTDVTFTNNNCPNDGGAIYNATNQLTINGTSNTFTNNYGGTGGGDEGGTIRSTGSVTISNAAFTGRNDGTADAYQGGAIYMYDTTDVLTLSNVSFASFRAGDVGGAVLMRGGTLTDVTFTDNISNTNDGGAIFNGTNLLTINGTSNTFTNNYGSTGSGDQGGTIHSSGSLTISNTAFTGRSDTDIDAYDGGAIAMVDTGDVLTISDSSFESFKAQNIGGAILMYGGTLTNVTFTDNLSNTNDGGAIFNSTNLLTINGTNTFTNNDAAVGTSDQGGAIYSSGSLTISGTSFSQSTAYEGGAIYITDTDTLTITDCTFDSNTAANIGGAIRTWGGTINTSTFSNNSVTGGGNDGGAIYSSSTLNVYNSTFSANSVTDQGGAIRQGGNATIKNSTFYNNTAGTGEAIYTASGTVTVANTIVAKSTSSSSLCYNVTSNDYNLQYNGTCFTTQTNDQSGDPLLSVLADNGGPTETHALDASSPAVDNALGSVCTDSDVNSVDQRGEARTTTCDIGAYEYPPVSSAITVCASGCDFTTINGAIDDAGTTDGDTIEVYDGTYSENINFDGKNITIQSQNGAASTTIQGSGSNSAVVTFSGGETASAVLDGFTIDNQAENTDTRGSYITDGAPTIQNCVIDSNTANYRNGAGVYITGSSGATFIDTDITNNTGSSNEMGGGIHHSATGTLSITGGNISSNYAYKGGGGIYQSAGTLTINGTTIASNTVTTGGTGGGGGIYYAGSGTLTITDATIQSNSSSKYGGGGLWLNSAAADITGTTFELNITAGDNGGGGILMNGTTPSLTLTKSHFLGNWAKGNNNNSDGGGIKIVTGTATITNSLFAGNVADNAWNADGGGIFNSGTLNLYFSTIADNYTYNNGALYAGGTENIYNSIIWGNSSGHGTAGIYGTTENLYLTETSSDPSFVTRDAASNGTPTTGGNYDLQSTSNCIDTGDETNAPSEDIEGNTRPTDIAGKGDGSNDYDKGAYEYVP